MNFSKSATVAAVLLGSLIAVGTIAADTGTPSSAGANARARVTAQEKSKAKTDAEARATVNAKLSKLPLSFERNDGQTDGRVKFLSRGSGYTMFLTPAEAVLSLSKRGDEKQPAPGHKGAQAKTDSHKEKTAVLRVSRIGAGHNAKIEGLDQQAGKVNYLLGHDPKKWHTNIPTFSRVKYQGVYPGVDLVYHGSNQRQLEYDFVVAPGADPRKIELGFDGAKQLKLNADGNLVLQLADPSRAGSEVDRARAGGVSGSQWQAAGCFRPLRDAGATARWFRGCELRSEQAADHRSGTAIFDLSGR